MALFGGNAEATEQSWQQLVDRLRSRLGKASVQGISNAEDHCPEHCSVVSAPGTRQLELEISERPFRLLPVPRPLLEVGQFPTIRVRWNCWPAPSASRLAGGTRARSRVTTSWRVQPNAHCCGSTGNARHWTPRPAGTCTASSPDLRQPPRRTRIAAPGAPSTAQ